MRNVSANDFKTGAITRVPVEVSRVETPWGDSGGLRARRLRPGGGRPRAQIERNQKERLFAALTATVAAKGYEATSVADLLALSGVSRSSFYSLFEDKQGCLLAAVDGLTGPPLERLVANSAAFGDERGARASFLSLLELVASQPAAARMCLVELPSAGPEATALLDRIVAAVEEPARGMLGAVPGRDGMPAEIVRGLVGGVQKVLFRRLLRGEGDRLAALGPELWEWFVCVPPPPGPLIPSHRRSVRPRDFPGRQAASVPADRVLRAMAAVVSERGYRQATVAEIVERARTSRRTFYNSFADKEAAMVAALDAGSAQMLAAALPAFRRAADWPHAVRDTIEAMLRFGAEEPEYLRLGAVEAYAAGRRALEQRETVAESLEELLAVGHQLRPEAPRLAPEAIGGALGALLYEFVRAKSPERLLDLVPATVYVALAPFLGAEEAYALAVG